MKRFFVTALMAAMMASGCQKTYVPPEDPGAEIREEYRQYMKAFEEAEDTQSIKDAKANLQRLNSEGGYNELELPEKATLRAIYSGLLSDLYQNGGSAEKSDMFRTLFPDEAESVENELFDEVFKKAVDDFIEGEIDIEKASSLFGMVRSAAGEKQSVIQDKLAEICALYNNEKLKAVLAERITATIGEVFGEEYVRDRYTELTSLELSKQAYADALNAKNVRDFKTALREIDKVITEDINYKEVEGFKAYIYSDMQKYITETMDSLMKDLRYDDAKKLYYDYRDFRPMISFNEEYTAMFETMVDEQAKAMLQDKKKAEEAAKKQAEVEAESKRAEEERLRAEAAKQQNGG